MLRRPLARVGFSASVTLVLALAGCAGGGSYTRQHSSVAKEKMAAMKSAMEWQTAQQQLLSGDTEKALKSIDRSLQLSPNVAKSHVLKGRILMEQGDLEGGLTWFGTAEGLDPENPDAPYFSALVLERLRQPEAALAKYRRAAEIEPSNPQYVIAAAEVLMDLGRLDEAEQELANARSGFAHNAGINQTRGHIAKLRGDHDNALKYFEEARLAAPDDPAIQNDLINAQVGARKFAEAETGIQKLLKVKGYENRRDLRLLRAKCLVEIDRAVDAREVLVRLTTEEDGAADVEAWIELGRVAFKLKDHNRARTAASRLIAIAPERPEGYQLRAMMFRRLGALDQARENAIKAVALAPSSENYLLLGIIERQLGNANDARLSLGQALEIEPGNTMARAQLEQLNSGVVASVTDQD